MTGEAEMLLKPVSETMMMQSAARVVIAAANKPVADETPKPSAGGLLQGVDIETPEFSSIATREALMHVGIRGLNESDRSAAGSFVGRSDAARNS